MHPIRPITGRERPPWHFLGGRSRPDKLRVALLIDELDPVGLGATCRPRRIGWLVPRYPAGERVCVRVRAARGPKVPLSRRLMRCAANMQLSGKVNARLQGLDRHAYRMRNAGRL